MSIKNSVISILEKLSYDGRQKRNLERYLLKKEKYRKMSKDELEMNYIKVLSTYEHKKTVLAVLVFTIFIFVATGVWKSFFDITGKLLYFIYHDTGTFDVKAGVIVILTFTVVIFLSLFAITIGFINDLKLIRQEKIFIDRFMNESW